MTQLVQTSITVLIAGVFLVPAIVRPSLGRVVLSLMFLSGALFNLLYTLPNVPGSLQALVATAPVPPYRQVIDTAVGWNAAPAFVVAAIIFEVTLGVLMLWHGPVVRLALLAAAFWGLGMLPVIPPDGLLIGIALTGAPGVAGLILARHSFPDSAYSELVRTLTGVQPLVVVRWLVQPMPAVVIFFVLCGLFGTVLHPWFMNWGSTPEERSMALPGDTAPPAIYFTRAVTIHAPPSSVWPWLLAIGQDRAGFLSNDYLENLTGADIHNADALRPDWQHRAIGDLVPMGSPGQRALFGPATSTIIDVLEPEQVIGDTPGRFVLLHQRNASTRLLLRESLDDPLRQGALWVLWDPMHFVMEQRMLQGIKERAEGQPFVPPVVQAAALVGWSVAGIGLVGLFIVRRGGRPWILLPLAIMAVPLWLTGDVSSFLAGFLAIGVTLMGFLEFGWRWLAPYLLLASGVALVLLLAPDSYAAFGLIFLVVAAVTAGAFHRRLRRLMPLGVRRPAPVSSVPA